MAVVSVHEDFDGRDAECNLDSVRNYTRVFDVKTNLKTDSGDTILFAAGIPALASSHPSNAWAWAIKKSAQQTDTPFHWRVKVDYSTKLPIDPADMNENPLSRPPQIRVSTNKFSKVVTADKNGAAVVNSAGLAFEGGFEVPDSRAVISITWNVSAGSFDFGSILLHMNKINSVTWNIVSAPGGTILVCDLGAEFVFENNIAYWRMSGQFEYNPEGWNPTKVLDQGYMELGDGGLVHQVIRDSSGQPVTQPRLLDGVGTALPPGGVPVYLDFDFYKTVDLNGLL